MAGNGRQHGRVHHALVRGMLLPFVLAALLYAGYSLMTRPPEGASLVTLSDMQLQHDKDSLVLRLAARVRLPPTVQAGLDSGVPLTFVLSLKLLETRQFWPDATVFEAQRHYTLTYYELTRHYRVSDVGRQVNRNFRSLSSALDGLGEFGSLRFALDEPLAQRIGRDELVASLALRLSTSALPLPLQPIIRSNWNLESEEYRWPVT